MHSKHRPTTTLSHKHHKQNTNRSMSLVSKFTMKILNQATTNYAIVMELWLYCLELTIYCTEILSTRTDNYSKPSLSVNSMSIILCISINFGHHCFHLSSVSYMYRFFNHLAFINTTHTACSRTAHFSLLKHYCCFTSWQYNHVFPYLFTSMINSVSMFVQSIKKPKRLRAGTTF
jgi:hypothetical protein